MTPDLKILADNKGALLLCEVAAWLHDMGKCADSFLKVDGMGFNARCYRNPRVNPHKAVYNPEELQQLPYWYKLSEKLGKPSRKEEAEHDTALWKTLDELQIDKSGLELEIDITIEQDKWKSSIEELILWGRPLVSENFKTKGNIKGFKEILNKGSYLAAYLGRSHKSSHIEKEEGGKDQKKDFFISSPFGYEYDTVTDLNDKLKDILGAFDKVINNDYNNLISTIKTNFKLAPGDTRRPINEVTLWDWSSIVAALYKAALAGALLGNKLVLNDLKWRLLAIRFNSEKILENASMIPILLARKRWLTDGLDRVKTLLEKDYPLGNEVYRDENGSIFVVPDIGNLLKIKDSEKGRTLEELISESLGYDGEVVVTPTLSDEWWGQGSELQGNDKIPPIAEILKEKPYSPPDPETVKKWWEEAISRAQKEGRNNPEICAISWTRPQGPTEKGFQRKASDYWAERVTGRAKEWRGNLDKTIWIDEVADENGRICLLTGKFDISGWLRPDGHIKTLLVKPPNGNNPDDAMPKTPSFARIRRIWETSRVFWEDVQKDFHKTIGSIGLRAKFNENFLNGSKSLDSNNTYEAELDGKTFSIFYSKPDEFLIIENLQWLASKLGASSEKLTDFNSCVEHVKKYLTDKVITIYYPEGGSKEKPIASFNISEVSSDSTSYLPAISILSDPGKFMAIVPANKAFNVAKYIKEKYEKEMGKVRNRLPLIFGMVFARSHTPLAALMDAGRRMLKISTEEETWILTENAQNNSIYSIIKFDNEITWQIPVKMGDGITDDVWYPYFYVGGDSLNCSTAFKGPKGWLVHVKKLRKGDKVKIAPSRFDFEFLDTSSCRFEISYEKGKRQDTTKSERPYFLEEIDDFIRLWDTLSGRLARSQIKNVIGLIETKREEWLPEKGNEVFEKFVHDILHNANWRDGAPTNIEELKKAAISGKLRDIVELNMDILKVRNKDKKEQEVSK